jgi:Protein of unknown function (DUF2934)
MNNHEERIRQHAYRIWEQEGRPLGQHPRHWAMAEKLVEMEDAQGERRPASPEPAQELPHPEPKKATAARSRPRISKTRKS